MRRLWVVLVLFVWLCAGCVGIHEDSLVRRMIDLNTEEISISTASNRLELKRGKNYRFQFPWSEECYVEVKRGAEWQELDWSEYDNERLVFEYALSESVGSRLEFRILPFQTLAQAAKNLIQAVKGEAAPVVSVVASFSVAVLPSVEEQTLSDVDKVQGTLDRQVENIIRLFEAGNKTEEEVVAELKKMGEKDEAILRFLGYPKQKVVRLRNVGSHLNIRSSSERLPNEENVAGKLKDGDQVIVISPMDNGFYEIQRGGYVSATCLHE